MTSGALTRFRVMAWVTGVVLAVSSLTALHYWPWYLGEGPAAVLWTAHGWLYILYVAASLQLAYQLRWKPVRAALVLLAGTVPFMSFVAERRVVADLRRAPAAAAPPAPAAPATPS